jgi:hypothetical protein
VTQGECITLLIEQFQRLARNGRYPDIAAIDFVADDGAVSVQVHLADKEANGGLPVTAGLDIGSMLREEFRIALAAAGAMHHALYGTNNK